MDFANARNFQELEALIRGEPLPRINKENTIVRVNMARVKDNTAIPQNNEPEYKTSVFALKDRFQKKFRNFERKTSMAEKAINPIGIKLNIYGVRDIKKALNQWSDQMEIYFTITSTWNTESCHSYAELSLEGNVESYI